MAMRECRCGRHFLDAGSTRRLCHQCRDAARRARLCEACGNEPIYSSGCCASCHAAIVVERLAANEKRLPPAPESDFATKRGPEHREKVFETKFGKWHG